MSDNVKLMKVPDGMSDEQFEEWIDQRIRQGKIKDLNAVTLPPFEGFQKIARLSREIVITEKIDGRNSQIFIHDDLKTMTVGSRTRWITPKNDNHGFARWCDEYKSELLKLGPGHHFGEWWGAGIQRRYGVKEKRFSLFNTTRWGAAGVVLPSCVSIVPELYRGVFSEAEIDRTVNKLRVSGSVAAPGFMDPEGIVIYHVASKTLFKKTLKNDESPKGKQEE